MQRFKSNYGGIETIVGVFPREQVEEYFNFRLPPKREEGMVMEIMQSNRQVFAYMVDDTNIEIRVVNA